MSLIPILGNLDDLAEAIADPPPNRPFERAVGEFGQTVCDRLSARPDSFTNPAFPVMATVCQPYLDGQGYDSPTEEFPFEGGQCAGVTYALSYDSFRSDGTSINTFVGNVEGPVSTFSVVRNGSDTVLITIVAANFSGTSTNNANAVFIRFEPKTSRTDGQPDNCGNPPGFFVPGPNPAPDPGPLPPGTGPQIDVRGNPVLVLPPNFSINPNFDIGFNVDEIKFGGSGGLSDEPPVGSPEETGANDGAGGEDDLFGEPPEGERWCGVCIRITDRPVGQPPIPGSPPYDVFPTVIGNARLLFSGSSSAGVDTAVRILAGDTCLWEPVVGLRPTGVYVNLLPGYAYARTPYSVPDTVS